MGHARALLSVEDAEEQLRLAEQTVKEAWSVRKLEMVIYQSKKVSRETDKPALPTEYRRYQEQVQAYLGTSVRIQPGKKRGKIEIDYYSEDDLRRIMDLMLAHAP